MTLEFDEEERRQIRCFVKAQFGKDKSIPEEFGDRFYYLVESAEKGFVITVYDKCTGDCQQIVNETN